MPLPSVFKRSIGSVWVVTILMVGVGLLFRATLFRTRSLPPPPWTLVPPVVDMGEFRSVTVDRSQIVHAVNVSDKPINIGRILSGCGCLTARLLSNDVIAPGQRAKIELRIQASAAKRESKERPYTIMAKQGDIAPLRGLVAYRLRPEVRTYPETVELSSHRLPDGRLLPDQVSLVVALDFDEPYTILGIESSISDIAVSIGDDSHAKGTYEMVATLRPNARDGTQTGSIALRTSSVKWPVITIPASITVVASCSVTPRRIILRNTSPSRHYSRSVTLSSPTPFRVLKIDATSKYVKPEFIGPANTTSQEIRIDVFTPSEPPESGEMREQVTIELDNGGPAVVDVYEIKVP